MKPGQYLDGLAEAVEQRIPLVRSIIQEPHEHADSNGFGHETTVVLADGGVLIIAEQLRYHRSLRSVYIKRNLHIESFSYTLHRVSGHFTRFDLDPTHQRHLDSFPYHRHVGTTGPLPLFEPADYGVPALSLVPGDPRTRAEFFAWVLLERGR